MLTWQMKVSIPALLFPIFVVAMATAQSNSDLIGDPLPDFAIMRFGTTRFQNGHSIEELTYSQDGKRLAARDRSGCISIWDSDTGHRIRSFPAKDENIESFSYARNGERVATLSRNGILRVYDVASSKELPALLDNKMQAYRAALSADGNSLAVLRLKRGPQNVFVLELWDLRKRKICFSVVAGDHNHSAYVQVAGNDEFIATLSTDGTASVFDMAGKEQVKFKTPGRDWMRLVPAPDGKSIAVAACNGLWIHDLRTGKELQRIAGAWHDHAAFSSEGHVLNMRSMSSNSTR